MASVKKIFAQIKKLNPEASIAMQNGQIVIGTPIQKLRLPKKFAYNSNHEIVKKGFLGRIKTVMLGRGEIKQIQDQYDLLHELKRLNPRANIGLQSLKENSSPQLILGTPAPKLNLPEGFYYDGTNFSNKNTTRDEPVSIAALTAELPEVNDAVDLWHELKRLNPNKSSQIKLLFNSQNKPHVSLSDLIENYKLPNGFKTIANFFIGPGEPQTAPIFQPEFAPLAEIKDTADLFYELRRLNPSVRIEQQMPGVDNSPWVLGADLNDLKLPEGFYYNQKNGITNKHCSASGLYMAKDIIVKDNDGSEVRNPELDENATIPSGPEYYKKDTESKNEKSQSGDAKQSNSDPASTKNPSQNTPLKDNSDGNSFVSEGEAKQ